MSKTKANAAAVAALLVAGGLVFFVNKPEPPAGETDAGSATPHTASAPVLPGNPTSGMKPGEVRPGEKPGTLVVQPFQPGPPKTISSNYRVPSHRDDARITKRNDGAVIFEQAIDLARQLHTEAVGPEEDVQILDAILRFYRLVYNTNPVAGENFEVIGALTGENPHKIVVFPADHPDINDAGELNDRWGTPYYFHALSGTQLDIWSAGPDRKRNTRDDLKLGLEPDLQQ